MKLQRRNRFAPHGLVFNTEGGDAGAGNGGGGGAQPATGNETVTAQGSAFSPPAPQPAAADNAWFGSLGDELGANEHLAAFKDKPLNELANAFVTEKKAHAEALAKMGDAVLFPDANATDEQRAAFDAKYRAAMVPANAKEYGLTMPEGMSDEVKALYDETATGQFGDFAKEIGLTKAQASQLMAWDAKRAEAALTSGKEAMTLAETQRGEAMMADLKKTHGANAERVLGHVGKAVEEFATADEQKELATMNQSQRVALANMLHKIATKYIGEDKGGFGDVNSQRGGATDADLLAQHQTIMQSDAYKNPFHPGHADAHRQSMEISRQRAELKQQGSARR